MLSKIIPSALKPILSQNFAHKTLTQNFFRAMSTIDVARIERDKQKLSKALHREIKFEEENYRYDETVNKFLQENGYSIRDSLEDDTVELTKKVGNATVQVVFKSVPPQFEESDSDDSDDEGVQGKIERYQEIGEDEPEFKEQHFASFDVYIIQTNAKALTFECSCLDSEINVNFVSVVNDVEDHKKSSKLERKSGYAADFSFLEEKIQEGFLEFLKGYGINQGVALFVEHFSQDKDQRQYMKWLRDVNEFIERPLD